MSFNHALQKGSYVKIIGKRKNNFGIVDRLNKKTATISLTETFDTLCVPYTKIEYLPPAVFSTDALRSIARFEAAFPELIGAGNYRYNFIAEDNYEIKADDFRAALTKFKENNSSSEDIYEQWFSFLIDELEEAFDTYNLYNINVKAEAYSESHMLSYAFILMNDDLFDEALDVINAYYEDMDKPITAKRYPLEYKKDFVRNYDDDTSLELATDDEIALFRMFAQELCDAGDITGLRAVGYGCYCENRAFKQDWYTARDCITKLYETVDIMPDKAFYANTLGYIYYYGRCNDYVPQYEEAYKYYSFGAFNRIYESQYKIADMYRNGYGVAKSPETAECIIRQLYDENIGYILAGKFDSKYADIALRMAGIYESDDSRLDTWEILYYYMKADFAIRMRMATINYYGDSKVYASIKKGLEEIKSEINFKPARKTEYYSLYELFSEMLNHGMKLKMSVRKLKNNKYKLTFKNYKKDNRKLFITVPEIEMCGLYDKFCVTAKPERPFDLNKFGNEIVFDQCQYGALYLDDKMVFDFDDCRFEIKSAAKTESENTV